MLIEIGFRRALIHNEPIKSLNTTRNHFYVFFQVQHYILVVQAQDAGHPALSSTLTVYCNVLDLNDNTPLFDPMSYTNEIFENVSVATSVVTVSATDLDSGTVRVFF